MISVEAIAIRERVVTAIDAAERAMGHA